MSRALPILLVIIAFAAGASNASAAAPDAFTATGPTATVSGSTLQYAVAGRSGAWTMQATAGQARQLKLGWRYTGYHAWAGVTVRIERFVTHAGQTVSQTLQQAGPVWCCAAPSGGFDYSGTETFDVQAGDVYGFRMTGGNADSDARLHGTLTLTLATDTTPPAIVPVINGSKGAASWYRSDASLVWSVTDPESAISSAPCAAQSVTADTTATGITFTCTATSAGGTTTKSVTIRRDTQPPVMSLSGADVVNGKQIRQTQSFISRYQFSASDTLSGLVTSNNVTIVCRVTKPTSYGIEPTLGFVPYTGTGTCRAVDQANNRTEFAFEVIRPL